MTRLQRFIITWFGLWATCMSPQASESSTSELGLRQPPSQVAEQVEILLDSAWVYINQGNSRALHWVHQSLHLAREQGYFKGEAQALEMEGLYYELVENNMEEASIRYFEAVKICQEHQLDYLAEIYHIIGVMFHVNDHYEKAEEYYTLALEVMHPDMHQELQKKCFINLGSLHSVREDFDQAAYYFHKSLTIDSSPSFDFDTYANLGNLYIRKNQPELALPYMEKATEIHPENVDSERNLRFLIDAKTRLKDTSGMGGIIDRAKSWLEKETKLREKSLMLRYLSDYFKEINVIVPVPLHPKKEKKRGFNQSEWIARGISAGMHKPVSEANLFRKIFTSTQTRKNRFERWQNVDGIVGVKNPEEFENQHILLVDDVVTTGSTLEACAYELLKVPGVKVSIATLAFADF